MDLSVIIVSYNTQDLILQTLDSVFNAYNNLSMEVFVVDNGSTDGTVEAIEGLYPRVSLICNDENVGYARANNLAMKKATGDYILLLNSDTIVQNDSLTTMIRFMEQNPKAGAAGCKVVKLDGTLDLACRRSFPTLWSSLCHLLSLDKLFPKVKNLSRYNLTYLDDDLVYQVDCLVGAFMTVRREAILEVGLLDEQFFMYGEDIDWCYRIKKMGWEIWYVPLTKIIHYKGASSKKKKNKMIFEFYHSMYIYYRKHYINKHPSIIRYIVWLGIVIGCASALFMNQLKARHG